MKINMKAHLIHYLRISNAKNYIYIDINTEHNGSNGELHIGINLYDDCNTFFNDYNNSEIGFIKTDKYNLVTTNDEIWVWEPEPIDNYFPLGHIVTKNPNPPKELALLVLSDKKHSNHPRNFSTQQCDEIYPYPLT